VRPTPAAQTVSLALGDACAGVSGAPSAEFIRRWGYNGCPHRKQKRLPGGNICPQRGQVSVSRGFARLPRLALEAS